MPTVRDAALTLEVALTKPVTVVLPAASVVEKSPEFATITQRAIVLPKVNPLVLDVGKIPVAAPDMTTLPRNVPPASSIFLLQVTAVVPKVSVDLKSLS